jgi:hypothetical protein
MTRRTRSFIFGAGLILVAGLGTGLVAFYSGGLSRSLFQTGGPEELAYVAADASVVGFVNVRDVMGSALLQKLHVAMPSGTEREQFQAQTGIDIDRDIDYVVGSLSGTGSAAVGGVVLIHGALNAGNIEALATAHGGTVTDYRGTRLIRFSTAPQPHAVTGEPSPDLKPDAKNDTAGYVAFLETGLVAVGSETAIEHAIDARRGANVTTDADLMKLIKAVDGADHNAWAVGRFDQVSKSMNLPEQVASQLPAVQWFAVAGRVDGGVSGIVRLDARDDQAAENLRDVARGALALARLQMGRDTKLDAVLNSLQLTGTGKTVELSFVAPPEILDIVNGVAGLANLVHPPGPRKHQ